MFPTAVPPVGGVLLPGVASSDSSCSDKNNMTEPSIPPIIGITADLTTDRHQVGRAFAPLIEQAGGVPIILPSCPSRVAEYLRTCQGFILSGGDDPIMEHWGIPTHPKATPIDPQRQEFELALLEALKSRPDIPVLGVCLGMQMMALHAGGALDQFLPDNLPTAGDHWGTTSHPVDGDLGKGLVHSHHRQAITDPGILQVVATAHDGVIEAVQDVERPFYLGVQWHPERTGDAALGVSLFERLVGSCPVAGTR